MVAMRGRRATALAALTALAASGCFRWQAIDPAPGATLRDVRVTRVDGTALEMGDAHWAGDTIVGRRRGARVAVPRDSVHALAVRRLDRTRTAWAAVGAALLFALGANTPPGSGGP